ncbi:MAG: DUF6427 family protein [Bacteroidia bacterium]|nr:DUF6427 family protein [Bacteroidia bacterium]
MVNLFRQNTVFAAVLLVALLALLRLPVLFNPQPYIFIQTAPLSNILFSWVKSLPDPIRLSYVMATVLVLMQALLVNYIVAKHGILYKDTFLPGLFFVVLNSLYPQQTELTPQLVSNTFIILMFQRLCYLYESDRPLLIVIDAGMYLGFAWLFNYDVAIFLPYILISVVIFTSFNIRYLILTLIGIAIPLYFAAAYFYLTNQFWSVAAFTVKSFERTLQVTQFGGLVSLIPLLLLVPILLIASFNLQANFFRNVVKTRRILQSIALLFFIGILGVFIENTHYIYALFYLSIPLSVVVAYYFISTKGLIIKEVLLLLFIGLSIYYQLKPF